jgi:hypothetical protein
LKRSKFPDMVKEFWQKIKQCINSIQVKEKSPGNRDQYPLHTKLGGPQSHSKIELLVPARNPTVYNISKRHGALENLCDAVVICTVWKYQNFR